MSLFFKQFKHVEYPLIVCLDEKRHLLSLSSDKQENTFRLSKLHFAILSVLFREHPQIITYEKLKESLKSQKISLVDVTRLHRKISELRIQLKMFNPNLEDFIQNLRGIGYHLPSCWEDIKKNQEKATKKKEQTSMEKSLASKNFPESSEKSFQGGRKNQTLSKSLLEFSKLMGKSIFLTRQGNLTPMQHYCVINRSVFPEDLQQIELDFLTAKKQLLQTLGLDFQDVFHIRLRAFLANFYTYISLSRVSEYMISHEQWCLWFEHEVQQAYEKIVQALKDIEEEHGKKLLSAHTEDEKKTVSLYQT
ncbi:MAG: winged helix-turn-helix domain-containing protein [Alphaproteobacteria bacterium]